LVAYREAVRLEGVAKLESGYFRIKRRRQRRSDLPVEMVVPFYAKYLAHSVVALSGTLLTYARLRLVLRRIMRDPKRFDYVDRAIMPVEAGDLHLLSDTRSTVYADRRREKAAA
jgi:hypothetical protein